MHVCLGDENRLKVWGTKLHPDGKQRRINHQDRSAICDLSIGSSPNSAHHEAQDIAANLTNDKVSLRMGEAALHGFPVFAWLDKTNAKKLGMRLISEASQLD